MVERDFPAGQAFTHGADRAGDSAGDRSSRARLRDDTSSTRRPDRSRCNRGVWYGPAAYTIWGLFPIYWKLFHGIPALEVLAHRIIWSFVARRGDAGVCTGPGATAGAAATIAERSSSYGIAALLIGVNWFLYVWAVNAGFVVETSLGYFMTPLVNVLLGVVVLRERLTTPQWAAVALAAAGVVYLTWSTATCRGSRSGWPDRSAATGW